MFYSKTMEDLEEYFSTDLKMGLSRQEAEKRLEKYGKNRIERKKSISPLIYFVNLLELQSPHD